MLTIEQTDKVESLLEELGFIIKYAYSEEKRQGVIYGFKTPSEYESVREYIVSLPHSENEGVVELVELISGSIFDSEALWLEKRLCIPNAYIPPEIAKERV